MRQMGWMSFEGFARYRKIGVIIDHYTSKCMKMKMYRAQHKSCHCCRKPEGVALDKC